MLKGGDIVLAKMQFTDTLEIKKRPALVLFESYGNVVVAGITSNTRMDGIALTRKEGAVTDSVIKLNYVFTISEKMVEKTLFRLTPQKRKKVYGRFLTLLSDLD